MRRPGAWFETARELRRSGVAILGLLLVVMFGLMALSHPVLMDRVWPTGVYDPMTGYDLEILHPSAPSSAHLLGTDNLGRDVLSMLLAATRPTWILSIVAALTTALVATVVSAIGAARRGWLDQVLSHVSDALLLLPAPIFMLVIGTGPLSRDIGPLTFGLIYGFIAGMGGGAIVLRSYASTIMVRPFIDAARVAGASDARIVTRHLIPHLLPLAAVFMLLSVAGAVVADGFVSFLGQTGTRLSWGTMVYFGTTFRDPLTGAVAWNALVPPAVALTLFS
ncbi:MAG: ABC transporter permease, partial [Acidimicrobiia bacterium]|nr:ABC transporter permease [Acidimicrobiia bacterium]